MKQSQALALLEAGHSLLLTGAAGTGKTYVLREFIQRSRRRGKHVAVTATTGLAATHLSGNTIHAWSGIGIHDELDTKHIQKMSKQRQELIRKADILVIDEISMLHDFRLDLVEMVTRNVRETNQPFGGLQVVLCGDFFQLPPVNRGDSRQGGFVIDSTAWQQGDFLVAYLDEQFRQADDQEYTDILNGIRAGMLTRGQFAALEKRKQALQDPWATHTRLLTTNVDVDAINAERLAEIDEDSHEFEMTTSGSKQYVEQLMRSCLAPPLLELKIGAHVMCIKNSQDRRYVNGSLGVVQSFDDDSGYPIIELTNGRIVHMQPDTWELNDGEKRRAQIVQLPLRLAWAITVHKSQGMTLDAARVDLRRAFVEGMGYVALSRVRGMKHLILDGLNTMALRVSPIARQIDAQLRSASSYATITYQHEFEQWDAREKAGGNDLPEHIEIDKRLFDRLKTWRAYQAKEEGLSAFMVAHNSLLEAIATKKPTDKQQLRRIKGMGDKKLEKYGDALLREIALEATNS